MKTDCNLVPDMENKILDLVQLPRPLLLLEIFTCVNGPNQKFRKKVKKY